MRRSTSTDFSDEYGDTTGREMTPNELPESGERMLPRMNDALMLIEHWHRYVMAQHFCAGRTVLDIASGEGYGAHLLSRSAAQVIGVDIDEAAIEHARHRYSRANLSFRRGGVDAIPVADKSIDVVVSFETLEHHGQHDEMMLEIKRVLREDGLLIISTPDKKYYSDVRGHRNPYHVRELYRHEFAELIGKYFTHVQMLAQASGTMSVLYPASAGNISQCWSATGRDDDVVIHQDIGAEYLIAIASPSRMEYAPLSVFDGTRLAADIRDAELDLLRRSETYRIGSLVVRPLKWLKKAWVGERRPTQGQGRRAG
jgi:ubiquinone/menaquinone biosynthesis C-methylase UbiE